MFASEVVAEDKGEKSTPVKAVVVVFVVDANDNKPVFTEKTYKCTMNENLEVGDPFCAEANIQAIDADIDPSFGPVKYSLASDGAGAVSIET